MKRKEGKAFAATWVDLDTIRLREARKTVRNPPRALRGLEKNLVHFCSFQRTQHSTLYTHEISQGWLNQIIELEKMHSYEGHFNEKLLFKRSEVLAPSRSLC